jgi:hypothetical protein
MEGEMRMGLRFRKSFKIAPGVRMNFGKTGVGLSVGGHGLRYTVHSSGKRTMNVMIQLIGRRFITVSPLFIVPLKRETRCYWFLFWRFMLLFVFV